MIPFARPLFRNEWKAQILQEIEKVLESGLLTNGPYTRRLEAEYSALLEGSFVSGVNSCTSALHIAMILADVQSCDEVIVPGNTFASTANAVIYCGGRPVFAEIDPLTLNIDPMSLVDKITPKTKAVIVVHIGGNPCEMLEIQAVCDEYGLALVEDCAHAHGSVYDGRPCGTFGDTSCFSFYPTKVLSGPEGGLVATSNEEYDRLARILVNQGRSGTGPAAITAIGYNYRMNELQAIVVLSQIGHMNEILDERSRITDRYRHNLLGIPEITVPEVSRKGVSSDYSFSVLIESADRDKVRDELIKRGIETSILYHPVHLQPVYRSLFGFKSGMLPITERACSKIISLPLFLGLDMDTVDIISAVLIDVVEGNREKMVES